MHTVLYEAKLLESQASAVQTVLMSLRIKIIGISDSSTRKWKAVLGNPQMNHGLLLQRNSRRVSKSILTDNSFHTHSTPVQITAGTKYQPPDGNPFRVKITWHNTRGGIIPVYMLHYCATCYLQSCRACPPSCFVISATHREISDTLPFTGD